MYCHVVRRYDLIEFKREYMKDIFALLRFASYFSIILALFCYYVLPFDLVIRQAW